MNCTFWRMVAPDFGMDRAHDCSPARIPFSTCRRSSRLVDASRHGDGMILVKDSSESPSLEGRAAIKVVTSTNADLRG
jgi:hypothetical protein